MGNKRPHCWHGVRHRDRLLELENAAGLGGGVGGFGGVGFGERARESEGLTPSPRATGPFTWLEDGGDGGYGVNGVDERD